ncbi:SAM-dependent methyltransferase [Nonomuraea thailandensis]|uniref:site-specific DNA-methyltransferase (adenine-specific) n=1 Tax=Nonomuraea thailandensis TaxID=1188745 RepID=A0A9X2GFF9_9ACTN|nr:N-6 DNA methylase [Nonomuraea thailandensis]MCP2353083.1 SAM-dependent methyltransferase [Nonomuraea thailandensis]
MNIVPPAMLAGIPDEAVEHGEVFTRRWIVEMILDLVDYRSDRDLAALRLVEPACGAGAFLGVIAELVSESCRKHERHILDALEAVCAFDLLPKNVTLARALIERTLAAEGWRSADASAVARAWVRRADYLLERSDRDQVDFVVGNPPYIRLEDVPDDRTNLYRALYPTMVGRADIYVGFFEAGLRSLRDGGRLGFICADRWMRNQYGRELRRLVVDKFALDLCITMHDVDAFEEQVAAYPAVTVLRRGRQEAAVVADTSREFSEAAAQDLKAWVRRDESGPVRSASYEVARLPHWFPGDDLWPSGSPARLAILEDLTERFTTLGDPASGVRVGIGVATGADKVFITRDQNLVEPERLLPLAMVRDTASGILEWSGHYLVNPWSEQGQLVDLSEFPRLRDYFERNADALVGRYIVKKNPGKWYKTIDKIENGLTERPKLFFPDMKLISHPVLDDGKYYPHHNLYFVTSDVWDLKVLGGLLLSKVAEAFIEAYAVKMRGKTLRFQAQYLRRIPVPLPEEITPEQGEKLADAFLRRDVEAATSAALDVYGLAAWPA